MKNKYYYTSACIMKYTVSCIREMFVVIMYSLYNNIVIIHHLV